MFYISQIFDRDTSLVLESVEASNISRGYNVYNSKILTCMLIDLRNTYVDIFDSADDSVESYRVYDLLKIIDSCKIKIEGLDILYFAANLKNNTASPTNLDSIKKLSIRKSIAVASRDYTRFIAKNKFRGIDISLDGTLNNFDNSLVQGDSLIIPDGVKSLGGNFDLLPIEKSTFNKVVIPSSLELNFDSCFILWKIFHNDNKVLIVDGDLRLTPRIFSNIQVDIFVRGRLSISSFKNYFESKGYDYISSVQRCYTVADKDFLYTIDLDKKKIFKSKNDGRFIY